MKVRGFLIVLLMVSISNKGITQPVVDSNFHLYLLAGQSNMAGRGEITSEYQSECDSNVLMLTQSGDWVIAKHPLHFDKPKAAGVGPGLAFGIAMATAWPGIKIGLVPCAVGGSSINVWKPNAYDSATKTHPYDDAIKRIQTAMQYGVFKGIIWHQGESDSNPDSAAVYLPKLVMLIGRFRTEIKNNHLPFVVGELGTYKAQYNSISTVLAQLPLQVPFTAMASSKGLIHKGDLIHFSSASAEEFGKRYARQMLQLQAK